MYLLEAIGALTKDESQKAASRLGTYQDVVTSPLDRKYDDEVACQDGDEVEGLLLSKNTTAEKVLKPFLQPVDKVRGFQL